MSAIRKTLVVGGGIGGLTAAAALAQAGCAVDLVEIKPAWYRSGVGIIQPANALRALDAIGVARQCLDNGQPYDRYDYTDAQGQLLSAAPGHRVRDDLPAFNGIVRGVLHDILLTAAKRAGATIRMGLSVESLTQDAEGVTARLTDGTQARYELVIGADGIYSPLRQRLFGAQHEPRPTGQSTWRVNMPRPRELTNGMMMVGPGTKAGFIPLSATQMYLLLVTSEVPQARFAPEELAPALLRRLEVFGGLVAQVRHHITPDAEVVYRPMEVVMLPAPWHVGRVVLLGDAAHASTPHLGQGAAMAIEDAVVLAQLVAQGLPASEVGAAWQARRFERACHIQNASFSVGEHEQGRLPDFDLFATLSAARARAAEPI